jgi:hypothetical protein
MAKSKILSAGPLTTADDQTIDVTTAESKDVVNALHACSKPRDGRRSNVSFDSLPPNKTAHEQRLAIHGGVLEPVGVGDDKYPLPV